jgi:hypothetical protein
MVSDVSAAWARSPQVCASYIMVSPRPFAVDRRRSAISTGGVSGGGVFHISRITFEGPLVAIATENRRLPRLIVSTRIKHFMLFARELNETAPSGTFG